jgi:hypothetical protein
MIDGNATQGTVLGYHSAFQQHSKRLQIMEELESGRRPWGRSNPDEQQQEVEQSVMKFRLWKNKSNRDTLATDRSTTSFKLPWPSLVLLKLQCAL